MNRRVGAVKLRRRVSSLSAGQRARLDRRYWEGVVDAYLELVSKGIRDVALPNFGVHDQTKIQWVIKRVERERQRWTLLQYERRLRSSDGSTEPLGYSYQVLIFAHGAKEKASHLKQLLENPSGGQERNRQIGRLLGYREDVVEEFVSRLEERLTILNFSIPPL